MNPQETLNEVLAAMAKILLWCFALGMVLLGVWFGGFLVAGDFAYRVHATMFDLSQHEFDLINYCGMALVKFCAMMLFLLPWIAIQLVLRGTRQ